MTKKRILDVTSVKKRDNCQPYSNTLTAQQNYAAGGQVLTGGTTVEACFIYCPTARRLTTVPRQVIGVRTASNCYYRGVKENVEIQVETGTPWQWRRICFTAKTLSALIVSPDATFGGASGGGGTGGTATNNWTYFSGPTYTARVINQLPGGSAARTTLYSILFEGTQAVDWTDPLTAKTDQRRVNIKYDKTMTIASGNEEGVIRRYPRWHGMNKTLMYDDDESGDTMTQIPYSVSNKQGMGDYFIVDIFRPRVGATTSDRLTFAPQSTVYWHEK